MSKARAKIKDIQRLGIIGGSGLGQALTEKGKGQWVEVATPFGRPSGKILLTEWAGTPVAFLSRHGPGHTINPSLVPYRANIFALKKLGVTRILASGATGSLSEGIHPGELVVADQVIDRTFRRPGSFFQGSPIAKGRDWGPQSMAVHVEFAEPFCPALRKLLIGCADQVHTRVHARGTYVCMEGPQFSTRAESLLHRSWGADLIGMTCLPEAKLAREAEICYALVALPTDYDCWKPHEGGSKEQLLTTILGNLAKATDNAAELLRVAAGRIGSMAEGCDCRNALKLAIWSDKSQVNKQEVRKLAPIVGRYFSTKTKK